MSEVSKVSYETPAVRVVAVETADAGAGLHVFRSASRIHDVGEDGSRVVASETVRQGVVDDANLAKLVSNREFKPFQPYKVPKDVGRLTAMVATPEAFEIMRRDGHLVISKIYDRLVKGGLLFTPDKSSLPEAIGNGLDFENLLFVANYDHSVVDFRGRPVPMAMHFDYMEGGISNDRFDLEKVAAVLQENPEVEILTEGRRNGPISAIPYYNASDERDTQIQFIWRPTGKSWDLMLSKLGFVLADPQHLRIKPEMVSCDIDFFGLEQFRIEAREDGDDFESLGDPSFK